VVYRSVDGGGTWVATAFPESNSSGYPTLLALDPRRPTTLYVGAGRAVLASDDAGNSWRSLAERLPAKRQVTALALDPRRSGALYVGLWNGGVFRSTDDGGTWSRIASFPVTALATDPARPSSIYAGVGRRDHRVMRSVDGGTTWVTAG
jgi:photosystem II stability/assembly factor-like uncharacterized protein